MCFLFWFLTCLFLTFLPLTFGKDLYYPFQDFLHSFVYDYIGFFWHPIFQKCVCYDADAGLSFHMRLLFKQKMVEYCQQVWVVVLYCFCRHPSCSFVYICIVFRVPNVSVNAFHFAVMRLVADFADALDLIGGVVHLYYKCCGIGWIFLADGNRVAIYRGNLVALAVFLIGLVGVCIETRGCN